MRKAAPFFAVLLAVMLVPAVAFAASPWTSQSSTTDKILHKLDYGVKNLLGGWTEIVRVPMDHQKQGMNFAQGIGQGLYNAVVYTIGGAIHTATFFCPSVDVPIPNDGVSFG